MIHSLMILSSYERRIQPSGCATSIGTIAGVRVHQALKLSLKYYSCYLGYYYDPAIRYPRCVRITRRTFNDLESYITSLKQE